MEQKIFSPGKLLLTSEYVVLDGALALAIPTKWGQEFFFEEIKDERSTIFWSAYHQNKLWLSIKIDYKNWQIIETNNPNAAAFILKILKNIQQVSPLKFNNNETYHLKTNLQFPADYGLGSSSTLMNNLAEWAEIDAFDLNEKNLGGSGYDIAVAQKKCPILFQTLENERKIEEVQFSPSFKDELIFIHLNKKQNSREGINLYRSHDIQPKVIDEFSLLTEEILHAKELENFSELMSLHEKKLSKILKISPVKEKYFENCPVFVKSLGAWGGDFVLTSKFSGFREYFRERGFSTIFSYDELIA